MRTRVIEPGDSADLRRRVLRGGRDVPLPGDEAPAHHVGVYVGTRLVATGNIREDPPSLVPDETLWRIRGMATEPDFQGQGAGSRVLDALLAHARKHGGGGVWCNARTPARTLYERAGFRAEGKEWEEADIGPHIRMTRPA